MPQHPPGSRRPARGDKYCVGGHVTGEKCNYTVYATGYTFEHSDGEIARNVVRSYYRGDGGCTQGGDSGGPVYTVRSDGEVAAKGIHHGSSKSWYWGCMNVFTDRYLGRVLRASGRLGNGMTRPRRRVVVALVVTAALLVGAVATVALMRSRAEYEVPVTGYEPTEDPRVLLVHVTVQPEHAIVGSNTNEDEDRVVVRVIARHPIPNWSGDDVGSDRKVRVRLDQPLGYRDVVDAMTDLTVRRY